MPIANGGTDALYLPKKENDMTMKNWKEFCLNVWHWLVRKPEVVNAQKPQKVKEVKGYSPERMKRYLNDRYEFRYNVLSEVNEFRPKGEERSAFKLLGKRELNALCLEIQSAGIPCWDRDVARYIHSTLIEDYHPFTLYVQELPAWDGVDRLEDLARRVSSEEYWVKHFHRWMLAVMAQWMGKNTTFANCVAPLLVSEEQGWLKSTFCKSLMPEPLQAYYTDQMDLSANGRFEGKLGVMGLVNLDEFDRLTPRAMAKLKNLMQLSSLSIREVYQEIDRLCNDLAPKEELEMVRNYMLGDMSRSYEGPFSLSDAWIYTETAELDDEFFVRSLDAIRSVTSEEIRTLAQRYFCKEKLIEVVAGKKV